VFAQIELLRVPWTPTYGIFTEAEGAMAGRKRYSREFKLEAVKLVTERGVTLAQAARELGVHVNVLRVWVRELRTDPAHAFPGRGVQKPEEAELARLRREVARLKMERDILKKAAAYFATESR
jgi:transposase